MAALSLYEAELLRLVKQSEKREDKTNAEILKS
jgi:hypothetical protein